MHFTSLSNKENADLRLVQGTYFHIQKCFSLPLSTMEAARAALDLPLAFVRKDAEQLALVALLSLNREDNASIGPKGRWMGGYMPAILRAHPFALAVNGEQARVVVDLESDWLSREQGEPLFDQQGNPTEILNSRLELMQKMFPHPLRDNSVLAAIGRSGLLEPWTEVAEDLLRINRQKLAELDDQGFLELRRQGALGVIFAHLLSIPRMQRLVNLARQKEEIARQQERSGPGGGAPQMEVDLDDDLIRFM